MPRKIANRKIDSRSARRTLPARREPHWVKLQVGLSLGYRRTATPDGTWIARSYDPAASPRFAFEPLGNADDHSDADGVTFLTYDQAQTRARGWVARRRPSSPETVGPYTVSDAVRDYLAGHDHKSVEESRIAANAHILPNLGELEVTALKAQKIREWRNTIARSPRRLRSAKGAKIKYAEPPADDEAIRRRRATANHQLSLLKRVLNFAFNDGKVSSDIEWRRVKPFKGVDVPVIRYLPLEEQQRLVKRAPADLAKMIRGALLTGCRYAELARFKVADFNCDVETITVCTSKGKVSRHVTLTDEGVAFFEAETAGKPGDALIFEKAEGGRWGKSHQFRPMRETSAAAKISPPATFHILRHCHGSMLAMKGVPLQVIAKQLGHVDSRVTERHYAHLLPSYVATTIRENFPTLGIVEKPKVAPIRSTTAPAGRRQAARRTA
jgi:integrase